MNHRTKLIFIVWALMLAFGLALEGSEAAALDGDCSSICNDECEEQGGCAYYEPIGCNCYWMCMSGGDGTRICMS